MGFGLLAKSGPKSKVQSPKSMKIAVDAMGGVHGPHVIIDGALAAARHLDSGYTIFGKCGPDEVIEKLASADVRGDRAVNPPKIERVTVRRGAAKPSK